MIIKFWDDFQFHAFSNPLAANTISYMPRKESSKKIWLRLTIGWFHEILEIRCVDDHCEVIKFELTIS